MDKWLGTETIYHNYILTPTYMFIVKAGISSVLFICSSYMKEIVKQLKVQKNKYLKEKKEVNNYLQIKSDDNEDLSDDSLILSKKENKNNRNRNSTSDFLYTHISLLFSPLPFTLFLQIISLYFFTFVGSTSDVMKNKAYLIFTLVQTISTVSSLLPLFF